jgi:multiple sugar transport system substrate-binding protein
MKVDYGLDWEPYWTKLQVTLAGGAPLDMCEMHDTRVNVFAKQGFLQPIDEYIDKKAPQGWPSAFHKSQVDSFTVDGKVYALPYDWATGGLYINLDWFKKAGVDVPDETWTWSDLLEAAKKLTAAGGGKNKWGMALPTDSYDHYPMVKAFGGEYVTGPTLKSHFKEPGTIAAFEYLYAAINRHGVMPNPQQIVSASGGSGDVLSVFASGDVAMLYTLNDAASSVVDLVGDKFKWTVAPTPKGDAGRFQFVGGSAWSLPVGSKHPDVTYKAMDALTNVPNSKLISKMSGAFSSRADIWQYAIPEKGLDPKAFKHTFYDLSADVTHPLYFPKYGQWDTSVYTKNTDALWANTTSDVAGVLAKIDDETQPLLS